MSIDIDIIKARAKNEYRLSKVRGEAMISVRIPGGILPAHLLTVARDIAETWGNGQIHLTTRQKLAMPGIRYEDIDNVNAALEPFLREIEIELCDVQVEDIHTQRTPQPVQAVQRVHQQDETNQGQADPQRRKRM
ncbi:hypothetical protein MJM43_04460, partial [Salmonella enterica subsp. enterica serovar Montevideo]|nr:hypothetical protein [Salmonella enterica subsp. enterica serovar Montevideo]